MSKYIDNLETVISQLKPHRKQSGIYQIKNTVSNLTYVGSSVNLYHRWQQHLSELRKGKHRNPHLQNAWNRYGEQAFEFSVLEIIPRSTETDQLFGHILTQTETYYIEWLETDNSTYGYNIAPVAGSMLGYKHTQKTKEQFVKDRKGTYTGLANPFFHQHHSAEAKERMSLMKRGRPLSQQHKEAISNSLKGKKHSEVHIARCIIAATGKKRGPASEEHKRKISAGLKLWWQEKKQTQDKSDE